jgi:hypothetical protein
VSAAFSATERWFHASAAALPHGGGFSLRQRDCRNAVAYTQVWRYDRGPMQFPVIIRIVDGVVQSIRFVK